MGLKKRQIGPLGGGIHNRVKASSEGENVSLFEQVRGGLARSLFLPFDRFFFGKSPSCLLPLFLSKHFLLFGRCFCYRDCLSSWTFGVVPQPQPFSSSCRFCILKGSYSRIASLPGKLVLVELSLENLYQ